MKDEDIKLPEVPGFFHSKGWSEAFKKYARQAVRMNIPAAQPKPSDPEPFDLARAMAGEPIVTRDGRKAVFVVHDKGANPQYRVLARIGNGSGAIGFCEDGRLSHAETNTTDLLMAPKPKRTVWVNIWGSKN